MTNMSTDNTSSTGRSGEGIGSKIRGAAEVVHGVGDNIRGTLLGAVDTAAGHQSENDEIAARGRMEVSQGMAKIRGAGPGAAAGYESGGGFGASTGATGPQDRPGGMQPGQHSNTGASGHYEGQPNVVGAGTQQMQPDYQQQRSMDQQGQPGGGYQPDQLGGEYKKDTGGSYQEGYDSQVDRKQ